MRLNIQEPESRDVRHDGMYDIHSIFPTIQGEGPFAGKPAIFVRLAGCNLKCPMCDTEYTEGRKMLYAVDLIEQVKATGLKTDLIVLTGGEPFRQCCGPLVKQAHKQGYHVQIETNGTLFDGSMHDAWHLTTIVCSPKARVNTQIMPHIDALKYVMRATDIDPDDGLPTRALDSAARPGRVPNFKGKIYLQPCDEQDVVMNDLNTNTVIRSCMDFGYILCLQVHKIVNLP